MTETADAPRFTPRYPTLIAVGLLALWVIVLCLPMFTGHFLGNERSDQTWTGLPFRAFWAAEFHRTGGIPLWNPYMFGGLPFVGAMHGDIFYPTSFLRLFLRADQTLNAVFAIHLFLAGVFTYVFLRRLGRSWTAAVVGGLAYQLSGIVASQVSPGHDGKMIVSSLLPLLLTALLLAIRERKLWAYGLVGLTVGLDLLSPQTQMTQYSLIFAGLFTLFLCFGDDARPELPKARWIALGLAALAVALGFGMAMIQYLPFIKYSAYAARVAGNQGWAYATSYAMPPANIFDWFTATFTGSSVWGVYWAGGAKLHSEYVGAAVLALVAVGVVPRPADRKLALFLGAIFLLFLLVALGPATPFYRLWYAVVPGVKVTRAAGMAFFIPTFVFACFASFGVERLERGEGGKVLWGVIAAGALLLLLGVSGGWVSLAENLAGDAYPAVLSMKGIISLGAILAGVAALAAAGLALGFIKGRVPAAALAFGLFAIVSADLYINARRSFQWMDAQPALYAPDSVILHMQRTPKPYRAMDLPIGDGRTTYPTAFLMGVDVPNVLGHHGNELNAYDQLLGGKNEWRNLYTPRLWNLLAVRYIVLPQPATVPGYHIVARTTTPAGNAVAHGIPEAVLYEADTIPPYARVIPAAAKLPEDQIVAVLQNPRLDYSRVLLLSDTVSVTPPRVDTIPPASDSKATVTAWEPGAMTVRIDPAPPANSWLLVSENWSSDWRATVDGRAVAPLRGQGALLSVPLPAGAREVVFSYSRVVYNKGKLITLASLLAIAAWTLVPPLLRRRSG